MPAVRHAALLLLLFPAPAIAQSVPMLPDSSGWGVQVLTDVTGPDGSRWVGTYAEGIFVLRRGAKSWERIRTDTTDASISMDFINAIAFGPRGEVWYGTVGNGWGLSTDGGKTWRNWTIKQLGPEWQYVTPEGISTRGDTTVIGTADGIQVTTDNGEHWTAIIDATGPAARGPADTAFVLLDDEYVLALSAVKGGWHVRTLTGTMVLAASGGKWRRGGAADGGASARVATVVKGRSLSCGFAAGASQCARMIGPAPAASSPATPRTTWFDRPIAPPANDNIDQTYRYGSTMGGFFQPHQGVEFNNPDGTPVLAIGDGVVVYSGRAEAGALTVSILHDRTLPVNGDTLLIFSVYYHNSGLDVKVGDRVRAGQPISRVGNTGRATNDHLHLEVHAAPDSTMKTIVDSLNRYPSFTTNPELWIQPLPGTGIVAGVVRDAAGARVKQARVYGIVKPTPRETPYAYAETYGDKNHPNPLYGEDFAVGDVPPGEYLMGVDIDGKPVRRRVKVEAGKMTWVEFRP